jgi:hypothetical protein
MNQERVIQTNCIKLFIRNFVSKMKIYTRTGYTFNTICSLFLRTYYGIIIVFLLRNNNNKLVVQINFVFKYLVDYVPQALKKSSLNKKYRQSHWENSSTKSIGIAILSLLNDNRDNRNKY